MGQPLTALDWLPSMDLAAFLLRVMGEKQLCGSEEFCLFWFILGVEMCWEDLPLLIISSLVCVVFLQENTSSIRWWGSSFLNDIPFLLVAC